MTRKYVDIVNKEKKEATVRLYGEIGRQVDADAFAQDLAWLDGEVDTVTLRINSPGGDVISGLSVISVIRSMKAFVHVYIDGVAASMAAVIAVCGDKISMQDYAKMMIHNPFNADKEAGVSDKASKALNSITDTLQTILSRRGCKKERIASLMSAETWFTAEEAKAEGLIDEILSSKRKKEFENLSTSEILSRVINEYKSLNSNEMDLKKIAAKLGLSEDATEQQILDKIAEQQNALQTQRTALTDHYLALGEKNGVVTEKNKERMKRLASADFELFTETILETGEAETGKPASAAKKTGPTRLSEVIAMIQSKGIPIREGGDTKTWDWYQKNDPKALAALEKENPKEFERLLNDYENTI